MWRHWRIVVPLLLFVLFVGARIARIEADPPSHYPTGRFAQELFVEGPAKAHEARRFGLFGTFRTKEADNYTIWRVQSPAYVYPLAGFFRTFGVGYASLRIFCALAAGLGLLAYYRLGREHGNPLVAPFAALLFSLSFFDIQLTRSGLIEPYLNGLLSLTVLLAVLSLRSLPWLLLCQLVFATALLTKQTALFLFPLLLGVGIAAHVQAFRRSAPTWQHVASFGTALALVAFLVFYVTRPDYMETIRWNFGHMIVGVEKAQPVRFDWGKLVLAPLQRVVDWERWREGFFYLVPLAPLAVFQGIRTVGRAIRRRPFENVDLVAFFWLLSALLALQLIDHVRPRFSLIVVPPALLLAGSFLASLLRSPLHPALRWSPLALALAVVVGTDLRWQGEWLGAPKYEFKRAQAILSKELDEESVVVGAWASPIAFATKSDIFYVKLHFNTSKERFTDLGVTHLLLRERGDFSGKRVARLDRKAYRARESVADFKILGRTYGLYRFASSASKTEPTASTP